MNIDKSLWYDWKGGNEWLFTQINGLHSEWSDALAVFFNHAADKHNFPYFLGALALFAVLDLLLRKWQQRGGMRQRVLTWITVFLVLGAGFFAEGTVVHYLKDYFAFPRPYVELGAGNVHLLEIRSAEDHYRSFPSGHAALITLMVMALSPVLAGGWATLATVMFFGVLWARIASGVHFPADVIGGVVVAWLVVGVVRWVVYFILRDVLRIRC